MPPAAAAGLSPALVRLRLPTREMAAARPLLALLLLLGAVLAVQVIFGFDGFEGCAMFKMFNLSDLMVQFDFSAGS